MSITSFSYLASLILLLILYHGPLCRYYKQVLWVASILFYALFGLEYLILILLIATFNHYYSSILYHLSDRKNALLYLWFGILVNVGILMLFKYFDSGELFANIKLLRLSSPLIISEVVIPLGISYYTFRNISHLVDAKRKKAKPAKNFPDYLTYLIFFPSVISGPIDRSQQFLPQLNNPSIDKTLIENGMTLIVWGLYKKICIADALAPIAQNVFSHSHNYSGFALGIGVLAFTYQLYCDFSGYTDIARGSAMMFGIRLTDNFDRPYSAKTVTEFWQRWHKSLSFWLRDYIFLPCAYFFSKRIKSDRIIGVSNEMWSYCLAIMITWLIAGLWHGDVWPMIIWGGLQGFYQLLDRNFAKHRKRILKQTKQKPILRFLFDTTSNLVTFCMISFSWIFFNCKSMSNALYIARNIFSKWIFSNNNIGFERSYYTNVFYLIILMELIQYFATKEKVCRTFGITWVRLVSLFTLACIILFLGKFEEGIFVYAQF